jgi:cytochrome c oxidase cbb3-type subunit IV
MIDFRTLASVGQRLRRQSGAHSGTIARWVTVAVTIYLLILVAAFTGIVIWVFGRKRKARFEAEARIPLDEDKDSPS